MHIGLQCIFLESSPYQMLSESESQIWILESHFVLVSKQATGVRNARVSINRISDCKYIPHLHKLLFVISYINKIVKSSSFAVFQGFKIHLDAQNSLRKWAMKWHS